MAKRKLGSELWKLKQSLLQDSQIHKKVGLLGLINDIKKAIKSGQKLGQSVIVIYLLSGHET